MSLLRKKVKADTKADQQQGLAPIDSDVFESLRMVGMSVRKSVSDGHSVKHSASLQHESNDLAFNAPNPLRGEIGPIPAWEDWKAKTFSAADNCVNSDHLFTPESSSSPSYLGQGARKYPSMDSRGLKRGREELESAQSAHTAENDDNDDDTDFEDASFLVDKKQLE